MTYAQAERWSAALARTLLARGAGKGTRVAFMFGNGAEWIVTFLAVMRIGGIAMPLSTLFRPAELRLVSSDVLGPGGVEGGEDRRTRVGALLRRSSLDELPQQA